MGAHDLGHDRQAEARTALPAVARVVEADEPVEHPGLVGVGDARTVVGHGDRHPVPVFVTGHAERQLVSRVPGRIVCDVADGPGERAGVAVDAGRHDRRRHCGRGQRPHPGHLGTHQVIEVDRLRPSAHTVLVGTGQGQHVLDEPSEPLCVRQHDRLYGVDVDWLPGGAGQVEQADESGERAVQFVRGIVDELQLPCPGMLDAFEHRVHGARQFGDLVTGVRHGQPPAGVSAGDRIGLPADGFDGPQRPADQEVGEQRDPDDDAGEHQADGVPDREDRGGYRPLVGGHEHGERAVGGLHPHRVDGVPVVVPADHLDIADDLGTSWRQARQQRPDPHHAGLLNLAGGIDDDHVGDVGCPGQHHRRHRVQAVGLERLGELMRPGRTRRFGVADQDAVHRQQHAGRGQCHRDGHHGRGHQREPGADRTEPPAGAGPAAVGGGRHVADSRSASGLAATGSQDSLRTVTAGHLGPEAELLDP